MSAHLAAASTLGSGALTIGGLAAVLLVLGAVITLHHATNPARQSAAGRRPHRGRRPAARKSLIVTAAKAAGLKVASDQLPGALAELSGRAAGHTWRAGKRHSRRAAAAAWRRLAEIRARLAEAAQPPAGTPGAATAIDEPGPAQAAPTAALAPASTAPQPRPNKGAPMPTPIAPPHLTDSAGVPADHQSVISRVAGFEPEDDAALIRFMAGECAALCAYSDSLRELYETCTSGLGLDPSAVHGLADYADASSEAAQAMARAHHRFVQVYSEVRAAVAAGVVMPHRGRFFTGQSA